MYLSFVVAAAKYTNLLSLLAIFVDLDLWFERWIFVSNMKLCTQKQYIFTLLLLIRTFDDSSAANPTLEYLAGFAHKTLTLVSVLH